MVQWWALVESESDEQTNSTRARPTGHGPHRACRLRPTNIHPPITTLNYNLSDRKAKSTTLAHHR